MTRLLLLILTGLLASAAPAQALPVAAVATFLGVSATGFVAAAATFVVNTVISMGLSALTTKLFGPKVPSGPAESAVERQASITQLNVGEVPREMLVGRAANGGSLARAFNYGGEYGTDHVVKVVVVADHLCDALEGFYVNDKFVEFGSDGLVEGYNGQLGVYWRNGSAGQLFPEALHTAWAGSQLHGDTAPASRAILQGLAYIVFDYTADAPDAEEPVWGGGHPQFLPVIRGKRCYDPRKDSTSGGSGPHRWEDPDTWEWTRNLAVIRYNFQRGVYFLDQVGEPRHLLIGRGLSAVEAPAQRVFAAANLCDELVDDGAGGTEPRYFADGVIRATQTFDQVETMFAQACGGQIIQPEGGVEVEPGQAKTPVIDITDEHLVRGEPVEFDQFGSDSTRVNTVLARYVEPAQKWADHAAPVLRDELDVLAEGAREETLTLTLVTRATQAQRVGEMRRRQARLERSAKITLGPWFAEVEESDWVRWTSARHTKGEPVVFRVGACALSEAWRNTLTLAETSFDVFGFGGSPIPAGPGQVPTTPPGALTLAGVAATAVQIEGDGTLVPAVRFTWTTPVDPAVQRIRAEIRKFGQVASASTTTEAVNEGVLLATNGVPIKAQIEVRLVPLGEPGRPIIPSAWIPLTTGEFVGAGVEEIGGLTPAELVARLEAAIEQGRLLSQGMLAQFESLVQARAELVETVYHNGQLVKVIVLDEIETRAEGDTFILSRVNLIGVANEAGNAFQLSETTLKVSPTMTWGQYKTSLQANFDATNAAITSEQTVRSSADSAMALVIGAVSTTVNGHTASITEISESLNGIEAQYVLAVSSGSRVAGMRLAAGGSVSSIAFSADQIGFTNGSSDVYPFAIVGGEVRATNLRVDRVTAGAIVTDSIQANNIVETEQAADNSTVTLPNGSPVTVVSNVVDVPGGKVTVRSLVNIGNSGGISTAQVALYRNGSFLDGYVQFCDGAWGDNFANWEVDDFPGAGTHTYSIVATRNSAGGGPLNKTRARLLVELRKTEA